MADETQTQDVAETTEKTPSKYDDLLKQIETMTVSELADFVKACEDRFGVSAAAPMMMAGPAMGGGADAAPAEEKTSFNVVLTAAGDQKIAVIKALREFRSDLGLKEAKDLVDGAPKEVLVNAKKDDANAAAEKLKAAGATVELK